MYYHSIRVWYFIYTRDFYRVQCRYRYDSEVKTFVFIPSWCTCKICTFHISLLSFCRLVHFNIIWVTPSNSCSRVFCHIEYYFRLLPWRWTFLLTFMRFILSLLHFLRECLLSPLYWILCSIYFLNIFFWNNYFWNSVKKKKEKRFSVIWL